MRQWRRSEHVIHLGSARNVHIVSRNDTWFCYLPGRDSSCDDEERAGMRRKRPNFTIEDGIPVRKVVAHDDDTLDFSYQDPSPRQSLLSLTAPPSLPPPPPPEEDGVRSRPAHRAPRAISMEIFEAGDDDSSSAGE